MALNFNANFDKNLMRKINWSPYFPKKHEPQIEILKKWEELKESDYDSMVICAGARFGKSALCGYIAVKEFCRNIVALLKNKREEGVRPIHIWIVAPTYDLADKVFSYIELFFISAMPSLSKYVSRRVPQSIKLPFGPKIECKSGDSPEGMLGESLDIAIVDECSRLKRKVWESYLYQRLGDRRGKAVFISTPFGKNWFHEEWIKAKEKGFAFHFSTKDNPYYPVERWEAAKKRLPEQVFKQEHLALFLDDAASVFRKVEGILRKGILKDAAGEEFYTMGVDLGKHEDFTVISVIERSSGEMVYFDRFNKIDYPFQKERIKAVAARYNNARVYIDSTTMGEPIYDDLSRDGVFIDDYKFSNVSKKALVEKLSIFIEQQKVFIPEEKTVLIDELKSFGYRLSLSGNIIYSAPEGLHDDCVYSFALAVWGLDYGKRGEFLNAAQRALKMKNRRKINQSFI